jgi:protein-tyrosine phosphatase
MQSSHLSTYTNLIVKIAVFDSASAAADDDLTTIFTSRKSKDRRLAWEGLLNARDLGGYPTAGGQETRWGAVVRSDNLTALTPAGQAALRAYGIRSIVDLRRPEEARDYPNPFAEPGSHGISYVNVPFEDPAVFAFTEEPESLTIVYVMMLDHYGSRVADVMTTVADAPSGGVLVHCMGGKDRTGLISALLLELAGVDRETVAADYAITQEYLRERDDEYVRTGPGERAERERVVAKYSARAEVMLDVLTHVDDRYGGVERYLLQAGVPGQGIARLRQRLVPAAG